MGSNRLLEVWEKVQPGAEMIYQDRIDQKERSSFGVRRGGIDHPFRRLFHEKLAIIFGERG